MTYQVYDDEREKKSDSRPNAGGAVASGYRRRPFFSSDAADAT